MNIGCSARREMSCRSPCPLLSMAAGLECECRRRVIHRYYRGWQGVNSIDCRFWSLFMYLAGTPGTTLVRPVFPGSRFWQEGRIKSFYHMMKQFHLIYRILEILKLNFLSSLLQILVKRLLLCRERSVALATEDCCNCGRYRVSRVLVAWGNGSYCGQWGCDRCCVCRWNTQPLVIPQLNHFVEFVTELSSREAK